MLPSRARQLASRTFRQQHRRDRDELAVAMTCDRPTQPVPACPSARRPAPSSQIPGTRARANDSGQAPRTRQPLPRPTNQPPAVAIVSGPVRLALLSLVHSLLSLASQPLSSLSTLSRRCERRARARGGGPNSVGERAPRMRQSIDPCARHPCVYAKLLCKDVAARMHCRASGKHRNGCRRGASGAADQVARDSDFFF